MKMILHLPLGEKGFLYGSGIKALAEGYGDGFVSTGNTGALLAGDYLL